MCQALTQSKQNCVTAARLSCAELAKLANYDGVEIMGSEGYLLNQFICNRTNKRTDSWGQRGRMVIHVKPCGPVH